MDDDKLKKEIKDMERQARQQAVENAPQPVVISEEPASEEPKMSFDAWWMTAQRRATSKLPAHLKEVVLADFKARGLRKAETKAKYDQALGFFGIQL